jgi:flavin reductase (DIM6/NTAB) family NADH-FMN oxidoreductase RutF
MYTALRFSNNFALNMLTKAQGDIAMYFADSTQPHGTVAFSRFPNFPGRTGAPLLEGALGHVECVIVEAHPAGDHTLYIGRAVHVESFEGPEPLLYYRGTLA